MAKEKKSKWIVDAKMETREELEKFYREEGEDPEDLDIEDFNSVEISVVREDNKHGIESYGGPSGDKIILFKNDDYDIEDIKWRKEVAEVIRKALNGAEL